MKTRWFQRRRTRATRAAAFAGALLCGGCLGPSTSDATGYSAHVLPRSARVPELEEDEPAKLKLDANDGVDGELVVLRSGYAEGAEVRYWDFGVAQTSVEPMWVFRRPAKGEGGEAAEIDHPPLVDSIPGDSAYSSLRSLYVVFVTERYAGERIASLRALEDAIELGLLQEPEPLGTFMNCPVVLEGTALERDGRAPQTTQRVYYRGRSTHQLCIGDLQQGVGVFALPQRGGVSAPDAYLPRRQNETQRLEESELGADVNEDGDELDSSIVFSLGASADAYTSLWREIEVVVSPEYAFGQGRAASELFDERAWGLSGKPGVVVEHVDTGVVLNRPLQGELP